MIAIDVERFVPLEQFRREADGLLGALRKVPTDAQTSEILYPGELEFRTKEVREREGVPIPEKTWNRVTELASELGLNVDALLACTSPAE